MFLLFALTFFFRGQEQSQQNTSDEEKIISEKLTLRELLGSITVKRLFAAIASSTANVEAAKPIQAIIWASGRNRAS